MGPTIRLALGLLAVGTLGLTVAIGSGLAPQDPDYRSQTRRALLCQLIAGAVSDALAQGRYGQVEPILARAIQQHSDLRRISVTQKDGTPRFTRARNNARTAGHVGDQQTHIIATLQRNGARWGKVRFVFDRHPPAQHLGQRYPWTAFIVTCLIVNFPIAWWLARRIVNKLNAASGVPVRIRSLLDTFAQGLVVINERRDVVLANDRFAQLVDLSPNRFEHASLDSLPWLNLRGEAMLKRADLPWNRAIRGNCSVKGEVVTMQVDNEQRTFLVNASPIYSDANYCQGVLATFDNITNLQDRTATLQTMITDLEQSRATLRQQNEELRHLATRDPLTGCLNRRAFFEIFENHFAQVKRYGGSLACILLDIDDFKQINDTLGHTVGDAVLRKIAQRVLHSTRQSDILCRYGGEEFCLVLPQKNLDEALQAAARVRDQISRAPIEGIAVTVSLGVAAHTPQTQDLYAMIQQADEAMYAAKNSGKNRISSWELIKHQPSSVRRADALAPDAAQPAVSYHTVHTVFSVLLIRSFSIADHSRRVADLCAAAAADLLSVKQLYALESAALLHDIGMVGLPDELLNKREPLSRNEQQIVQFYTKVGIDVIRAAFSCDSLTEALSLLYHDSDEPRQGHALSAEIFLIAHEFDQLTFDSRGQRQMSNPTAFQQLRCLAGSLMTADRIEHFITKVSERDACRDCDSPSDTQPMALFCQLQSNILEEMRRLRDEYRARAIVSESTLDVVRHL